MKLRRYLAILTGACLCGFSSAHATVTFEIQIGLARDSFAVVVADGTLWALVADTNDDDTVGGVGLNSHLSSTATADTFFDVNQSLKIGDRIGDPSTGDMVFAMGGFNGADDGTTGGLTAAISNLNYSAETGTAAGRNFVFFWFPGATYSGGVSESISSQVGGINASTDDGAVKAMILPTDGSVVTEAMGAADAGFDGSRATTDFHAVNLTAVPEPSAALFGAFSSLLLLRRRR